MRDSVASVRYSSVCNVLRKWRIWLIPTYRWLPQTNVSEERRSVLRDAQRLAVAVKTYGNYEALACETSTDSMIYLYCTNNITTACLSCHDDDAIKGVSQQRDG